jgi:hypothetical protein
MSEPQASRNDPTPEERTGDASIQPVVIGFVVTVLLVLAIALVFLKLRQAKAIPSPHEAHPTSQILRPSATRPLIVAA